MHYDLINKARNVSNASNGSGRKDSTEQIKMSSTKLIKCKDNDNKKKSCSNDNHHLLSNKLASSNKNNDNDNKKVCQIKQVI
jgi:hypothetical protein